MRPETENHRLASAKENFADKVKGENEKCKIIKIAPPCRFYSPSQQPGLAALGALNIKNIIYACMAG
jgi:hypothetical protein